MFADLMARMKKIIVGAVFAVGAGIVLATPAVAAPDTSVSCSNPCVAPSAAPAVPPWTAFFSGDPWGKFFDATNGVLGDTNVFGKPKGAWESGVEAVNGGAWEKAFPPAP